MHFLLHRLLSSHMLRSFFFPIGEPVHLILLAPAFFFATTGKFFAGLVTYLIETVGRDIMFSQTILLAPFFWFATTGNVFCWNYVPFLLPYNF